LTRASKPSGVLSIIVLICRIFALQKDKGRRGIVADWGRW
jgi:hypothetical protein